MQVFKITKYRYAVFNVYISNVLNKPGTGLHSTINARMFPASEFELIDIKLLI